MRRRGWWCEPHTHRRPVGMFDSSVVWGQKLRLTVAVVAVLAGGGAMRVASASPAAGQVKVASGVFHGVPWTLRAQDTKDGSWCMSLTLAGKVASTCDKLDLSNTRRSMNFFGHPGRPGPDFWAGPITAKAKRVVLTYTDGRSVSVPTIPAPTGLVNRV